MTRLLLCLVLSASLLSAEETYSGKYAETAEWAALREGLPATLERSGAIVRERLGAADLDLAMVVLEIRDLPLSGNGIVPSANTWTRRRDGKAEQVIRIHLEPVFAGIERLDTILTHELTHAALRILLGENAHEALPHWVREGLAVWAAGQGPNRVRMWLCLLSEKSDPVAELVNGLEAGKHVLRDYPEDWLAIAYLEDRAGVEGVRKAVKLLAGGMSCHDAFAVAAGQAWGEFEAGARAHAESALTAAWDPALHESWAGAMANVRARRWDAVEKSLAELLEKHADTWAGDLAGYYVARARARLEREEQALGDFDAFIAGPGRVTGLLDDALWHSGACLEKLGRFEDALAGYDRIARDFPWSGHAAAALLRTGSLAEEELDRAEDARERYERLLKALPKSKEADEARGRLAEMDGE
ncbi:MAG: tetratricopeptide repeat protein [Planctomycetes bacterium]|nr:tetratricopeptide repeat protein [Planctomycetota bacterium]